MVKKRLICGVLFLESMKGNKFNYFFKIENQNICRFFCTSTMSCNIPCEMRYEILIVQLNMSETKILTKITLKKCLIITLLIKNTIIRAKIKKLSKNYLILKKLVFLKSAPFFSSMASFRSCFTRARSSP